VTAWKDHERRIARALGGERSGPLGRHGSDATGTSFAVECKRTVRYCLKRAWIEQARRQAKAEGLPWLLVIAEHHDPRPIVVMDFAALVAIAREAGLVPDPVEAA
jgi:hypothetical protein